LREVKENAKFLKRIGKQIIVIYRKREGECLIEACLRTIS